MHFVQADKLGISERHLPFTTFTECPTDSVPLFYSILQFLKQHILKSIKYSKAIGSGNPPSLIPAMEHRHFTYFINRPPTPNILGGSVHSFCKL